MSRSPSLHVSLPEPPEPVMRAFLYWVRSGAAAGRGGALSGRFARARYNWSACCLAALPRVHVERALAGGDRRPEPGLAKRRFQVRLQDPGTGLRPGPAKGARRGAGAWWLCLQGPIRGRERRFWAGRCSFPGIVAEPKPAIPFQHPHRRLPSFFFALVPWGVSWTLRRRRSVGPAERPGNRRVQRLNWSNSCLQVRVVGP